MEKFETWNIQDETREMSLQAEELKSLVRPEADKIVVGFHKMSRAFGKEQAIDMETVGTAAFFNGVIAIRDPFGEFGAEPGKFVLTHELAHLFGAVHVSGARAIMRPALEETPEEQIDPDNVQIIKSTRAVDFSRGLDSLSAQAIDGLTASYEKLIRANPHSDFYYQLGFFYRKKNMEARAVSVWEEAVRHNHDNPQIHYQLGMHYHKQGQYDRAIQSLASSIAHFVLPSQQKQKANVLNFLGVAYFQKDHEDQAIYAWLQGLTADPESRELQSNLAAAYLKKGDVERAYNELIKFQAKHPGDPVVLANLGSIFMQKKEFDKAAEYYSQALARTAAPKDEKGLLSSLEEWDLRTDLGAAYIEMKQPARAVAEFTKAKNLKPGEERTARGLARAYIEMNDFSSAYRELKEALAKTPKDPYLQAMLAQSALSLGKKEEAVSAAREGIRNGKPDLQAMLYRNLGTIYGSMGDFPKAAEALKAALNLDWKDADAHFNLGVTYANQQNFEEARRSFQNALRIRPDYGAAKTALADLEKVMASRAGRKSA